jgi:WD40 repeat protein
MVIVHADKQDPSQRWNQVQATFTFAGKIRALVYTRAGKLLAAGYRDKPHYYDPDVVVLWDVRTGGELFSFKVDSAVDTGRVFVSPQGELVAETGGHWTSVKGHPALFGVVKLWDVAAGKERPRLVGHTDAVHAQAFAPDSRTIATGSHDHTVRLWDAFTGKELACLKGHTNKVTSVAFSLDGKWLVSASEDGTARLWNVAARKEAAVLGARIALTQVVFAPDGKTVAVGSDGGPVIWTGGSVHVEVGSVLLWDTTTGKKVVLKGKQLRADSLAFSRDGKFLRVAGEVGGEGYALALYEVSAGKEIAFVGGGHWGAIAYSRDGQTLAVVQGWSNNDVWFLGRGRGQERATFRGHNFGVSSVAFSPDGKTLASAPHSGRVKLWDVVTGRLVREFQWWARDSWSCVAFSPDGTSLATGGSLNDRGYYGLGGTITVWDVATGKERVTFAGHRDRVYSLAFSPDGKLLATGGDDGKVILWDWKTGKRLALFEGHKEPVHTVAFSPDGKSLASGSWRDAVCLWDVANGEQRWVHRIKGPGGSYLAFSPDGQRLACSGGFFLNSATGEQIGVLPRSTGLFAFSRDGKVLVIACDGGLKLWDVAKRVELARLRGHHDCITCLILSPDGRTVASGSDDGTVKLWDVSRWLRAEAPK